jgi:polar amino acid transport system permease protein
MNALNFNEIAPDFGQLLWGCWLTIRLSAIAMLFGLLLSIAGAFGLRMGHKALRSIVVGYIEIIRNTPFLVQIFLIYFGFPAMHLRFSAETAALTAMVLNVGAYGTEIVRAGLDRVSSGQIEAGRSLGLTSTQVFFLVALPPAMQAVYPALTSQFTLLLLGSSVVSAISAEELTSIANDIQSRTFRTVEVYLVVMLLYFLISSAFRLVFWLIEKWVFVPYAVRQDAKP